MRPLNFGIACQGVVTPIGPVLTSATAVKMVKTEIKEWSSGQGSLEPLSGGVRQANYSDVMYVFVNNT